MREGPLSSLPLEVFVLEGSYSPKFSPKSPQNEPNLEEFMVKGRPGKKALIQGETQPLLSVRLVEIWGSIWGKEMAFSDLAFIL